MHRGTPQLRHRALTWRLVGASVALLWLLSASSVAPALTALLALADRSHHLAMDTTAEGVEVILHHDCSNSPAHHHGLVARTLVLIAEQSPAGQPDHVIQFVFSAPTEPASGSALEPSADAPAPQPVLGWDPLSCLEPLRAAPAVPPRSHASGSLLSVRSIIRLI